MPASRATLVVRSLALVADRIVTKLTLDVVANLVRAPAEGGTPVDTGWARANWIPRIGAPFSGTDGTRAQAEAGSVSRAQQEAGIAAMLRYKITPTGKVFITNNVPYIGKLNDGWSKQAPKGFVQAAIKQAVVGLGQIREVRL